jgi:ribosomal protein L35
MPKVVTKSGRIKRFPYTKKGNEQAKKLAKKLGVKVKYDKY